MAQLPKIGSVVKMDGGAEDRAAKLLATICAYLAHSITDKAKRWRDTLVDAGHFEKIFIIVREGIDKKRYEDLIAEDLA